VGAYTAVFSKILQPDKAKSGTAHVLDVVILINLVGRAGMYSFGNLVPRPSSLVGKIRERKKPGRIYHVTDVTDCDQF
jgi:hypothetical protein